MDIEVERKVHLSAAQQASIEAKGCLLRSYSFQDTYFDDVNYSLTTQSLWLRKRDENFELKARVGAHPGSNDIYEELTGDAIAKRLYGCPDEPLETLLAQHSVDPFCSFRSYRTTYAYHDCQIDIDEADFGDFSYRVVEIEVVVRTKQEISHAERQIETLAEQLHLDLTTRPQGKLIAYLKTRRPEHYQALIASGAVRTTAPVATA